MAESDGSVATEEGSDGSNDFSLFHAALGVNRTARPGGREDDADDNMSADEGGVPGEVGVNLGPPSSLAAAENPLAGARGVDVAGILPSDGGQQRESTMATSAPSGPDPEENVETANYSFECEKSVVKRDRSEAFGEGTHSDSGSPQGKKSLQENSPADGAALPRGWKVERYADGGVYEGELKDGKRHGHGKLTYVNGNTFEGEWRNGKKHGKGKYTWTGGDVYEGEWEGGKKHGNGKLTYADGGVYDGQWEEGKKRGKGNATFADGSVYVGQWRNGKRHGQGKLKYPDGGVYEGEFKKGNRHGNGKLTWPDGDVYEGPYKDGKRHGNGKFTWADGRVHEGEWNVGEKHGKGTFTCADGTVLEGVWYHGNRHGDFAVANAKTGAKHRQVYRYGKRLRSDPVASRQRTYTSTLTLEEDDMTCGICKAEYSSNLTEANEGIRRHLPVLGSCDHHCCHGCVLKMQATEARRNNGRPEKIKCMTCRKADAFCPGEPKYFRVLADFIERSTSE